MNDQETLPALLDQAARPGLPARLDRDRAMVKERFWAKVRRTLGRVPFLEDAVAAYYCALDPDTPTRVRGTLFAALAYFILPLDSIPDFLVGFGLTDDIAVLSTAISIVSAHITQAHRDAAREFLDSESIEKKSA